MQQLPVEARLAELDPGLGQDEAVMARTRMRIVGAQSFIHDDGQPQVIGPSNRVVERRILLGASRNLTKIENVASRRSRRPLP